MASQSYKFTLGLFIAAGTGIALAAVIWLGMSSFLEQGRYYVAFFNESVQGLVRDSAVKYRGVSVGRVERIEVAPDSRLIQVVLKIESDLAIDSDTVAQLKSVGITGSMFVELDRKRTGEPDRSPQLSFPTEYPVVASKPSDISEILRGIDEVLQKFKDIDVAGISERVKTALDNANELLTAIDAGRLSGNAVSVLENADRSLTRIESIVTRVDGIVIDKEQNIKDAIDRFTEAVSQADALLQEGTRVVGGVDDSLVQLRNELMAVARNLERASDNLNHLLEQASSHPAGALFGEPPSRRALEVEDFQEQ